MTDRELLELAAIACGELKGEWIGNQSYFDGVLSRWDPLENDGDALRLAVSLWLIVEPGQAWVSKYGPMYGEDVLQGANAATRRAIVRAAAEIGKGMK